MDDYDLYELFTIKGDIVDYKSKKYKDKNKSKFIDDRIKEHSEIFNLVKDVSQDEINEIVSRYRDKIEHDNELFISETILESDFDDAINPSRINIKHEVKTFLRNYDAANLPRVKEIIKNFNEYTKNGLKKIRKTLKKDLEDGKAYEINKLIRSTTYANELLHMDHIYSQFGEVIYENGDNTKPVKNITLNNDYIIDLLKKDMSEKYGDVSEEIQEKSNEILNEVNQRLIERLNRSKATIEKIKQYGQILYILATCPVSDITGGILSYVDKTLVLDDTKQTYKLENYKERFTDDDYDNKYNFNIFKNLLGDTIFTDPGLEYTKLKEIILKSDKTTDDINKITGINITISKHIAKDILTKINNSGTLDILSLIEALKKDTSLKSQLARQLFNTKLKTIAHRFIILKIIGNTKDTSWYLDELKNNKILDELRYKKTDNLCDGYDEIDNEYKEVETCFYTVNKDDSTSTSNINISDLILNTTVAQEKASDLAEKAIKKIEEYRKAAATAAATTAPTTATAATTPPTIGTYGGKLLKHNKITGGISPYITIVGGGGFIYNIISSFKAYQCFYSFIIVAIVILILYCLYIISCDKKYIDYTNTQLYMNDTCYPIT